MHNPCTTHAPVFEPADPWQSLLRRTVVGEIVFCGHNRAADLDRLVATYRVVVLIHAERGLCKTGWRWSSTAR
jgi:hypothetical protein